MQEEIDYLGLKKDESLPEALRVFMESDAFKKAIEPGGNGRFPCHLNIINEALQQLKKSK